MCETRGSVNTMKGLGALQGKHVGISVRGLDLGSSAALCLVFRAYGFGLDTMCWVYGTQ